MADEFSKPLGQRPARSGRRLLFDPLLALGGLVLALAILAGGWVVAVDDPLGGEPKAVAKIDRTIRTSETEMRAEEGSNGLSTPQSPLPDLETIARNIRILDANGAPVGGVTVRSVPRDGVLSLAPAPDPRLVEASRFGPLPRISDEGSRPADVYARPVVRIAGSAKARVAIVMTGLGLGDRVTNDAIHKLPGAVSLAFMPYGERMAEAAARARQVGHEVVLQVPMEPFDYPDSDPGPRALLASLPPGENVDRLRWAMGRFPGYAGVTSHMGGRLLSAEPALRPFLEEVKQRGLYYLDQNLPQSVGWRVAASLGLQAARSDLAIDQIPNAEAIDSRLAELETLAEQQGAVLAFAAALPITIDRITRWAEKLGERGVLLVPASAVMPRPNS